MTDHDPQFCLMGKHSLEAWRQLEADVGGAQLVHRVGSLDLCTPQMLHRLAMNADATGFMLAQDYSSRFYTFSARQHLFGEQGSGGGASSVVERTNKCCSQAGTKAIN